MTCKYCGSEKNVRDGVCFNCSWKRPKVRELIKELQNLKEIIEELDNHTKK